jgi:hypothetical protein
MVTGDFWVHFKKNLDTNFGLLFSLPGYVAKTVVGFVPGLVRAGRIIGPGKVISNAIGTVGPLQAVVSASRGVGVANLAVSNTLASGAVSYGLGGLAVTGSLAVGMVIGSAIDAGLKTHDIDLSGGNR